MTAVHFPTSRTQAIRHKKRLIANVSLYCNNTYVTGKLKFVELFSTPFYGRCLRFTFATLRLRVNVPATICVFFPQRIRFTTELTDDRINFAFMKMTHELYVHV